MHNTIYIQTFNSTQLFRAYLVSLGNHVSDLHIKFPSSAGQYSG